MSIKTRWRIVKAAVCALLLIMIYLTRATWITAAKITFFSCVLMLSVVPLCRRLEQHGVKSGAAAFFSLLVCVLILVFFLLVFVPYLISGVIDFVKRVSPMVLTGVEQMNGILEKWGIRNTWKTDTPQLFASALTPLTAGVARGSAAVAKAAGHAAFSLVIAYYLLVIRHTAARHCLLLIPLRLRNVFLSALSGCKNAVLSYLSGTLKTSAFVGSATLIGLAFLGVKDALTLALFMSVLEVLPYIGPVLGAIPIILSVVPMGIGKTLMAMALVLVVQQLESGVVGPYFTASSTSIHPLAAIAGVYLGGSLFGIPGIILTIPVLIVLRSVFWSIRSAAIRFES